MARNASNNSFGSSVGPGNRPSSRSHTRSRSNMKTPRPATSMGTRVENKTPSGQNGTALPQPTHRIQKNKKNKTSAIPKKKVEKWNSVQDISSACKTLSPSREASFCNEFSSLSISGQASHSQGFQAILQLNPPVSASDVSTHSGSDLFSDTSVCSCSGEVRSREQALVERPSDNQVVPKTPSRKDMERQFQRVGNSARAAATPARGAVPSPNKGPFLSKYTNTTGFVATDIDERLGKFENDFLKMKEMMDSAAMDKDRHIEELGIARKRGSYMLYGPSGHLWQ